MSDPRNVAHDKKTLHEKEKQGVNTAKGAEHAVQPGKKPAKEKSHGAHKETELEEAGGNVPAVTGEADEAKV